jgi:hypothetical protein
MATTAQTTETWRRAGEARDAEMIGPCLASGVQLISPLTEQFRFRGREQVRDVLAAAFMVVDVISFHTQVGEEDTRALFYYGRIRGQDFEEAQLLRFDGSGLISEITLFGRPLPGLTAVMAEIGPALLRAGGKPGLARLIGAATAPLAAVTKLAEKRMVPLADPNR